MSKLLAILLALLLCCQGAALADSAWVLHVDVNETEVNAQRFSNGSFPELLRFLGTVTLRHDEQEGAERLDLRIRDTSYLHFDLQKLADGYGLTSDLFPGLQFTVPVTESADSAEGELAAILQQAWDAAVKAAKQWADSLTPEGSWGSYASEVFEGGVYRERYRLDDGDLALLTDSVLNAMRQDHLVRDYLESQGELLNELHELNLEAARSRRFSYLLDVVYKDYPDSIAGWTLQVLDRNVLRWSLSYEHQVIVLTLPQEASVLYLEARVDTPVTDLKLYLYQAGAEESLSHARERSALLASCVIRNNRDGEVLHLNVDAQFYQADKTLRLREEDVIGRDRASSTLWLNDSTEPLMTVLWEKTAFQPFSPDPCVVSYPFEALEDEEGEAVTALQQALEKALPELTVKTLFLIPVKLLMPFGS